MPSIRDELIILLNEYQCGVIEALADILQEQAVRDEECALLDAKVSLELAHKEREEARTLRLASHHVSIACETILPRDMKW